MIRVLNYRWEKPFFPDIIHNARKNPLLSIFFKNIEISKNCQHFFKKYREKIDFSRRHIENVEGY